MHKVWAINEIHTHGCIQPFISVGVQPLAHSTQRRGLRHTAGALLQHLLLLVPLPAQPRCLLPVRHLETLCNGRLVLYLFLCVLILILSYCCLSLCCCHCGNLPEDRHRGRERAADWVECAAEWILAAGWCAPVFPFAINCLANCTALQAPLLARVGCLTLACRS